MIWFIAAILVAMPYLTSGCGGKFILNASNPKVTLQTPNYPKYHNANEECTWHVSAPGNVEELSLKGDLHMITSANNAKGSFSFYNYHHKIKIAGIGPISLTLKGSTNIFTFKSSMTENSIYKGVIFTVSYDPNAIPTCTTPVDPSCNCGEKVGRRIVGGTETTSNAYPWQAGLIHTSSWHPFCGGSLIAKQWVLSASHCVEDESPSSFFVSLGENIVKCNSTRPHLDVIDIIMHEKFGQIAKSNNDIALIKLTKQIEFSQFILPICLPFNYKYYDFTNQIGITAGWGLTIFNNTDSESTVLKEIDQKIIMYSKCTVFDGYKWHPLQITENMICALAQNGTPYSGDSGSPMVWESVSSGLYFQLGVTSLTGISVGPNEPTLYAKVSKFVNWIMEKSGAGDEFCVKI